jgi:hypothetical protein
VGVAIAFGEGRSAKLCRVVGRSEAKQVKSSFLLKMACGEKIALTP